MTEKYDPIEAALQTILRKLERDEGEKYAKKIEALRKKRSAPVKEPVAVQAAEKGDKESQDENLD